MKLQDYLIERAGLTVEEVKGLEPFMQRKTIQKGEFALRAGEICEESLFIEEGLLRFYTIDNGGKEHIVQFAPEGWFLADRSSIFFHSPTEYFIDAIEETKVAFLSKDFMCQAAVGTKSFAQYNETLLQRHIGQLQHRISMLIGASAEERYLEFVKTYPDLMMRVPQWMIASYLGITPESLSRVRKELSKKGL
ncbi:Crp/Fnr family transcriptional regulator [Leadbetterella byssophila]|uniref:Crp/Fnr family transcriptional regulator n=1 Tax=Leadbetterella byssophila TaxID=316068 RepID=UPI00399FED0B